MNKFGTWLAGNFTNPATGQASHTKIWTNIAYAVMTYKFVMAPEPVEWMWWAYGGIVGGFALVRRGLSVIPQLAAIKKETESENDVDAPTEKAAARR